uniref:Mitochondrial import receptor subunit TOM7 homolog n=1 Tax=Sus scrofa TaxID=9823 RepID=A0A4X1UC38_PIG
FYKISKFSEGKPRLQQLFQGSQFAICWGFVPLMTYLGFQRHAGPEMSEPTFFFFFFFFFTL